jgi:hypothetical protein
MSQSTARTKLPVWKSVFRYFDFAQSTVKWLIAILDFFVKTSQFQEANFPTSGSELLFLHFQKNDRPFWPILLAEIARNTETRLLAGEDS